MRRPLPTDVPSTLTLRLPARAHCPVCAQHVPRDRPWFGEVIVTCGRIECGLHNPGKRFFERLRIEDYDALLTQAYGTSWYTPTTGPPDAITLLATSVRLRNQSHAFTNGAA